MFMLSCWIFLQIASYISQIFIVLAVYHIIILFSLIYKNICDEWRGGSVIIYILQVQFQIKLINKLNVDVFVYLSLRVKAYISIYLLNCK